MIESGRVKILVLATVVFSTALGIIAASLPDKPAPGYRHQEWVQPPEVARRTPVPISSHEWTFDYRPVEDQVQMLTAASTHDLALNNQTLERLERIASALPETLTDVEIERIGFLSQQGLGDPIADDLAGTLKGFLRYQQAVHDFRLASDAGNSPVSARTRLERSIALQNQFLGANRADPLFRQQRRLWQYLIERQAIHANPDLSPAKRQEALDQAAARFKLESAQ